LTLAPASTCAARGNPAGAQQHHRPGSANRCVAHSKLEALVAVDPGAWTLTTRAGALTSDRPGGFKSSLACAAAGRLAAAITTPAASERLVRLSLSV
jgi:hypothetical protein